MKLAMAFFWFGSLADTWTTIRGLEMGGVEQNPLARWLFKKWPDKIQTVALALKFLAFVALLWMSAPALIYWIMGGVFLALGIYNYRWIKRRK